MPEDRPRNYIRPNEDLIKYMHRKLEIRRKVDQFNRLKKAGEKRPADIVKEELSVNNMKVDILNKYVFPAMANLTFLFEATAEYPELQATFEQDLKDLLGIRRYDRKALYGYMLRRLIGAILIINNEEYDNDVYENKHDRDNEFRFKLLNMLQILIWQKFWPYLERMFPDNTAQTAIASDFFRVNGWTGLLGFSVKDDYTVPNRTFEVKSAKEIIEANK